MTLARSLAASVVSLGFASSLTAAPPAFAAPAPCERAENYAAQSGAELLRINRLEVSTGNTAERPPAVAESGDQNDADRSNADTTEDGGSGIASQGGNGITESGYGAATRGGKDAAPGSGNDATARGRGALPGVGAPAAGTADRVFGANATPFDPTDDTDEDSDTLSEGIGMLGEAALNRLVPGGAAAVTDPDAAWKKTMEGSDAGRVLSRALPANALDAARQPRKENAAAGGTEPAHGPGAARTTGMPGTNGAPATTEAHRTTTETPATGTQRSGTQASGAQATGTQRTGTQASGTQATGTQASGTAGKTRGTAAEGPAGAEQTEDPAEKIAGRSPTASVREVGLGESRAAFIATTRITSAAIARILDGKANGKSAWTEPVLQQAPPTHGQPTVRRTPAGQAGPLRVGAGRVSAHAQWDAGMACGRTTGETSRSVAQVSGANLLGSGDAALVRVPQMESASTTALDGRGEAPQTVASAAVKAGEIMLAGGRVRVRVVQPPRLEASMSSRGGRVRYQPAQIEVSGGGADTRRLTAAGQHVDLTLGAGGRITESGRAEFGDLRPGAALPLPAIPGLPQIGTSASEQLPILPKAESAAAAGTRLRISLGGARQVQKGKAIAARATAIKVSLTRSEAGQSRDRNGYGAKQSTTVRLDLTFGLLEAAAVAPEKAGQQVSSSGGGAGDLPITGPQVASLVAGGVALLLAGAAAIVLTMRRRKPRA
jgi:hypothetical protein